MADQIDSFGKTATSLARNPLGIIALFIVLVYGFACVVAAFAGSFSVDEKAPLIYFLVVFPVLVLGVFTWLVICHSGKLFAPTDFRNEDNYVKLQQQQFAVASLAVAASRQERQGEEVDIQRIVSTVQQSAPSVSISGDSWRTHVLWVDDRPQNNVHVRRAFEALGLHFTTALSTGEALQILESDRFAAIISDMGRVEGPREGYVLLDAIRKSGNEVPVFFYASSKSPEHRRETAEHGGQGCTNDAQELFQMVMKAVISASERPTAPI